jgi:hypothetical protein
VVAAVVMTSVTVRPVDAVEVVRQVGSELLPLVLPVKVSPVALAGTAATTLAPPVEVAPVLLA